MRKTIKLMFLLFTAISFFACSDDSFINRENETNTNINANLFSKDISITAGEYGFYHNEAVIAFLEVNNNSNFSAQDMMDIMIEKMSAKYPSLFKDAELYITPQDVNYLYDFYKTPIEEFDYETTFITLINENVISDKLNSFFKELIYNKYSYEDILYELEYFRNTETLNSEEIDTLLIFESTFIASNELWGNQSDKSGRGYSTKWKCSPRQQTAIADGLGTVVGSLLFGVFGPLVGAGYSVIIDEMQNQRGGGCI